jgi:signal transduction histidine kinase
VNEGYAHGAVDYISSPVVPAILRAKVKVFVDLFRLNSQIRRHAEQQVALAEERSRREAAEESNRRLSFLARAGAVITKSLDRSRTSESILRLLVPEHADEAVLAEIDAEGRWRGVRAGRYEETTSLAGNDSLAGLPEGWQQTLQCAWKCDQASTSVITAENDGPEARYLLAMPLRDREQVFAILMLVRGPLYGPYSQADIALFESVAWRSAIALVNSRLYQEIERADQQKNRFLSMLAHELRNPLAPIRSAVDVLRLCGDSPSDFDWARDVIDRQVNHLIRLVDDLLDISRITLGKIRLQPEIVNAADLVKAAVEISRPLIEKNQHHLVVEVPSGSLELFGDRARLTQVLANLLNNAAKYTPPGGSVFFGMEGHDDQVVFRIRDTGIGIPSNMLDKVFDMFIQIDSGLDRAHGGLGIGLTLVRELVNMHHGSISVASPGPGRGSEFSVSIPTAIPAANTDHLDQKARPLPSVA